VTDNRPHHFGDPCIHCGVSHDAIQPGPCKGDIRKAKPIAYRSLGVRYDGVERYLVRMSTGYVSEIYSHVSYHLPYYHFGHARELIQPPRYDERLTASDISYP